MKIVDWPNNEKVLWHCCVCEDAKKPEIRKKIEIIKEAFGIEKVTSGVHEKCMEVLERKYAED